MRRSNLTSFLSCLFSALLALVLVTNGAMGWQHPRAEVRQMKLKRDCPDGWFNLFIPAIMGTVERYVDVDGGFYLRDELEISYDYWTHKNTPNFLRDVNGNYVIRPRLSCTGKAKNTRNFWTTVDGRRGLIQRCSNIDERRGLHHVYGVSFPNMRVPEGEGMKKGTFNLTIIYKDERYLSVARQIVRSIDF